MRPEISNIPASIQAKLQKKAHENGQSFNEILQYYGMERFLYRLSKTQHVNDLVLKGGLMFYGLGIPMRRTTRDIDFLGMSETTQQDILSIFHDALSVSFPEDGVLFDTNSLQISQAKTDCKTVETWQRVELSFSGIIGGRNIPRRCSSTSAEKIKEQDFCSLLLRPLNIHTTQRRATIRQLHHESNHKIPCISCLALAIIQSLP